MTTQKQQPKGPITLAIVELERSVGIATATWLVWFRPLYSFLYADVDKSVWFDTKMD